MTLIMVKPKPQFSSEFLNNYAVAMAATLGSLVGPRDIEAIFNATKHMEHLLREDNHKQIEENNKTNNAFLEVQP